MSDYSQSELTGLSPKFFKTNRDNFIKNLKLKLETLPEGSFLFLKGGSNKPRYDNDDDFHYFVQESNFYYLTGVLEPNFYAIIDLSNSSLSLFVPLPDERTKVFMHVESLEDISKKYECKAFDLLKMPSEIKILKPNKLYVLNGINSDSKLKILTADYNFVFPYDELNDLIDHNTLIYEILADTRTRKTNEEIELLKYLTKVTCDAHKETMKKIKENMYERDVENIFYRYIREHLYIRNHPYEHICGCGLNSATLHYIENDQKLKKDDLILIDMGGTLSSYCSDITITIPVSGKFSDKQKEIYTIVYNANREVMKKCKPGINWVDMHLLAEKVIIEGLQKLGLLKSDVSSDVLVNKRVGYYFMPHGLGHLIGLNVHDAGGYLSFTPPRREENGLNLLRSARNLAVGNIYSVEPGIYFIPFLLEKAFKDNDIKEYFIEEKVREYFDFGGIRIEDDVLITEEGCVNLSESLPRTVEEIEEFMKK